MSTTNKYHFYVKDAKDLDFQRIFNETAPETKAILISTGLSYAIGIRTEVLAEFDNSDGIQFHMRTLYSRWGEGRLYADNSRCGVALRTGSNPGIDWPFRFVTVVKDDLEKQIPLLRAILAAGPPSKRRVDVQAIA